MEEENREGEDRIQMTSSRCIFLQTVTTLAGSGAFGLAGITAQFYCMIFHVEEEEKERNKRMEAEQSRKLKWWKDADRGQITDCLLHLHQPAGSGAFGLANGTRTVAQFYCMTMMKKRKKNNEEEEDVNVLAMELSNEERRWRGEMAGKPFSTLVLVLSSCGSCLCGPGSVSDPCGIMRENREEESAGGGSLHFLNLVP